MAYPELASVDDVTRRTNFRTISWYAGVRFVEVEREEDRGKLVVITFDIRPNEPSHEWGILGRLLHPHQEEETSVKERVIGTRYDDIVQRKWPYEIRRPVFTTRLPEYPDVPFFIEAGLCSGNSDPAVVEAYMLEQEEGVTIPEYLS